MKKLKSLVAAVLVAVISTVCFSACKKKDNNETPTPKSQAETLLNKAYQNLKASPKFMQTFSSSVTDNQGGTHTVEDSSLYNPMSKIAKVKTNVSNGVVTCFVDYVEDSDIYQVYEQSGENIVITVYDILTKKYETKTVSYAEFMTDVEVSCRADYDFISVINTLISQNSELSVSYSVAETETSKTVSVIADEPETSKTTRTFTIENEKITSYKCTILSYSSYTTIELVSKFVYDTEDIVIDKNNFIDVNFDEKTFALEVYNNIKTNGMQNHTARIETQTDATSSFSRNVLEYKYSNANAVECYALYSVESPIELSYYEFEKSQNSTNYLFRDYNVLGRTYTTSSLTEQAYNAKLVDMCVPAGFFDIILNDAYKNKEYSSRIADGVCTITIISWADDYESSTRVVLKIKEGKIISASRNYESLDERSEVSVSYTYGTADVNHNKNGYVAI